MKVLIIFLDFPNKPGSIFFQLWNRVGIIIIEDQKTLNLHWTHAVNAAPNIDFIRCVTECQRRSKNRPLWRSKTRPPWLMLGALFPVISVVHRRDPRCFV
jgi:hypothetical protein